MKRGQEVVLLGLSLFFLLSCSLLNLNSLCFAGETKVNSILAVSQGYDNNVYLDSRRKEDGFTQLLYKTTLTSSLNDNLNGILEYGLMSLIYAEESNLNLITNDFRFGIDYKINSNLNFLSDYHLGIIDYVNTGVDDALEHTVGFKLKQKLPKKMFHSLGYELMFKDYSERRIRTITGLPVAKKREDLRSTLDYEIGKFFPKDLIKIKFEYYNNNANERYLHYYDYDSYTGTLSLTHLLTKKMFLYLSYARQIIDYRNRTITVNNGLCQEDKDYILTSSLYYNLQKNLTVGLSFTYRKQMSNEPVERYQDSVVSLSTYYKF